MAIAHQYTAAGYYIGSMEDGGFLPNNATYTAPPEAEPGKWPRWNGSAWELVEDHRERSEAEFGAALAQKATDYWLPGDTHETPARHMTKPGPLPAGALRTQPTAPEPTEEEKQTAIQAELTDAVQRRLDEFAQTRGYDGIMSAATYATSAIERFRREGERAVTLRDNTWAACYAILADVLAGERPVPTLEELVAELPALTWE